MGALPDVFPQWNSALVELLRDGEYSMKKFKTLGIGFLVLALAAFFLGGCSGTSDPSVGDIAVEGTWTLDTSGASWTSLERWTIDDLSITYESNWGSGYSTVYEADIVRYDNAGLNAGDTAVWSGGSTIAPGYAVIRFTQVDGAGTGEVGKYQVFRWATNESDASLRDFTQGSKDSNLDGDNDPMTGTYVNVVFDTADGAEAGATIAGGHFAYGSAGASRE